MTATEERPLRIGEVAEQVGVTTRTIRYYEELGLLAGGPERSKGAHRYYTEADVSRLRELIRLRDLLGQLHQHPRHRRPHDRRLHPQRPAFHRSGHTTD